MGCVDDNLGGIGKSLNFRVDINIHKPLRRGVKTIVRDSPMWIRLRYVKLPDFCYVCGLLGHSFKSCEHYVDGMEEEDIQYGSWLRASPIKSRRRNAEGEMQEERKLLMAYKNRKGGSGAKAKLDFSTTCADDHSTVGGAYSNAD